MGVDRPEDGTRKALEWDFEMGRAYKDLAEHPAWKDLVARLFVARDGYYATLASGEWDDEQRRVRGEERARAGIQLVEWLLAIPAEMIILGEESEQDMRRVAAERNGSDAV